MLLSYRWLKELIDVDLNVHDLADILTATGLNIENVSPAAGEDFTLNADITTNRPDWLCHLGVAHEISAVTGKKVNTPCINLRESSEPVNNITSVTIDEEAKNFCPRYTARIIKNIQVKESPEWLKQRLISIGQRPINNIVDITNLVCFEMNQPLHAFDLDKLSGKLINVRLSEPGEKFVAITGEVTTLSKGFLVIADREKPIALAGVKGGANTQVDFNSKNILLESAWFQPQQVRRSAKSNHMYSESSYRYERGIDPGMTAHASARAASLILELAGGDLAKGIIDTNPQLAKPWQVTMRYFRCSKVLGFGIATDKIKKIFLGLGLTIQKEDQEKITVEIPTFRRDLTREIDLIEEIIRVSGYDNIPEKITMPLLMSHRSSKITTKQMVKDVLISLGYHECITDSFVANNWCQNFVTGIEEYQVLNPINTERPLLRTSLIPSLLEIRMVNKLDDDSLFFEVAHTYEKQGSKPVEPTKLAIIDERGLQYIRGAFEEIIKSLKVSEEYKIVPKDTVPGFCSGSGASIYFADKLIGIMGIISKSELSKHSLKKPVAALEISLEDLILASRKERFYTPLAKFPAIRRDIALVVQENTTWQEIKNQVIQTATLLEEVRFESIYRGKGIDDGSKCIAFSMIFRAIDRSLTDEEINLTTNKIISNLITNIQGAKLRQ